MNLLVDIGNTRIKAALAEGTAIRRISIIQESKDWAQLFKEGPANVLISSVRKDTDTLVAEVLKLYPSARILNHSMRFPVALQYETPESLGMDRLAASVGAASLSDGSPVLAIMAGTCITCDLVVDNSYLGGSISPGVRMRLDAMHHFTSKLPQLEPSGDYSFPGKSTIASMQSGAIGGTILEIHNRILTLRKEYPNLVVFISGGDAALFESSVNPPIFVTPDLIFVGLNRILEYNV